MARKVNMTPQRKLVYDTVLHSTNHPTAGEIIEYLRDGGHKLAYATVYNSLKFLTDSGLLRELKIGDSVTRYDARTEQHYHLVCRSCGQVNEVYLEIPRDYLKSIELESDYKIEEVDMVLLGICSKCRSSNLK